MGFGHGTEEDVETLVEADLGAAFGGRFIDVAIADKAQRFLQFLPVEPDPAGIIASEAESGLSGVRREDVDQKEG